MTNIAKDIIWPNDENIIARIVFLYVGQGDCTIVLAANGDTYKTGLVDINLDSHNGGIHVPKLMVDLLEDKDKNLDVFINTHPHNDHLSGVAELCDLISPSQIWHSGHKPSKNHNDAYTDLKNIIKKVKEAGGTEIELNASKELKSFGEIGYYILSPASYVVDDIEDEAPEDRYRRIHEQCAVLKFGIGSKWVLLTGDADRDAWEKHITDYHEERLQSAVLSAPHHGSRSFFKDEEGDDPYLDALNKISPVYVVVSAPTSEESQHDHPHSDAISLYVKQVGDEDNILHTGKLRHSFICDIYRDGEMTIQQDNGALSTEYGIDGEGEENNSRVRVRSVVPPVVPPVDSRPMGDRQK